MLTEQQRRSAFAQAVNIINGSRGKATWREIVSALERNWAKDPPDIFADRIRLGNIVNAAQRSIDYGKALNRGETPAGLPPIDYTTDQTGRRFSYRVVIEWDAGTGRGPQRTLVILSSDRQLSADEVEGMARAQGFAQARAQRPTLRGFSGDDPIVMQAHIVSGGRSH